MIDQDHKEQSGLVQVYLVKNGDSSNASGKDDSILLSQDQQEVVSQQKQALNQMAHQAESNLSSQL